MQEEMNDEIMDLAIQNIHKLIPEEWMPRINEILPKVLNIVKMGIKKNIKNSAEQLGDNKMFIMMNFPHQLKDGSIIQVPTMFRIDKSQLGPSRFNAQTGNYELDLKAGEVPELTFSMLSLAEKINSYESIEQLTKDVKEGTFMTLKDINYTGDKSKPLTGAEQKQLESGS